MATPAAPLNATTNAIAKGTVVFVQGEAYVRDASGKLSVIKPGDIVVEGQEIITKAGAIVEFELPTGVKVSVGPDRQLLLNDELFATTAPERSENVISSLGGTDAEKVIQALNDGKDPFADLDDTAAGLAGGGIGDQTHDFVRLVRVLENVTPVSYNYTSSTDGIDFLPAGSTTLPVNTPPTATADTNLQGTEDQPLNVDVLANDSDPENDPLVVVSASALNGQVTVNPDGSLRYVPKADFNGTDTVTYTISDGKGGTSTATATINVAAVNDAPVAIADTSSTPEDTPVTFAVLGNDSDPDGNTLTVTGASVDPAQGSVIVNANGTLTFTPAPNVNGPVTVTYTISDGNGGTATTTAIINVTPLADTAILGTGTGTVKEDTPAQTSASGTLSIVDPDAGQAAFQPQTNVPGTYGSFGVDAAGNWTYTLDNSRPIVQALAEGSVRAETFTVTSIDGTETTVTVNVIGTNDGPVATPDTATTNEDEPVTFAVLGNDTDPDGNTLTVTGASVDPSKGSVIVNANGTLTFTPAPNVNGPVTVTYTITDGHGGTATTTAIINVTPLADTAVLGTGTGTVKEDTPAQTSASGTLSIVDPDAGQAAFQPQTNVAGTYGNFGVDAAGNWTYTLDNSRPVVQALAEGSVRAETFTVTSIDGTETTVTVNVIGTNDGPVATPDTATTNEDEPVTFAVLGNDTDPDGNTLTVTGASVDPAKGSVVVNANGTLTFTPAPNVNGPVTVTYTIADGHGGTSSTTAIINVAPVADTAIISSDTGITREDTTLLASGTLTITDGDAGEAAFQVQAGVPGTFGSFSIDTSGHWSYTLDNGNPLVQGLADGDTRSESFTVKSIDGTESTVVVTILGQNEIIGAPGVGIVKEDNPITTGGTLTASGGATFVPQPTTPGTYGNLSLNPDGNWTYTLNNPASVVQSLGEGQTRTETFPVSLSDGTTSTITITVVGTNDPAIVTPGSGSVTEDSILSTGGTLTVTDPDAGEAGFRPQTNVVGTYGSFTLDAAGNWTYTLNNANLDVQNLGLGDTLSENFPVQSTDGTPSSVAITINGTNDGPVATPDTASTDEETPVTFAVLGNDTDPDGNTLTVTGASVDPAQGSVVVNANGTLTFTPAPNVNGPVTVTYTISDGNGGTATTTAIITVTPLADTAILGTGTGTVKEDTPAQTSASGTLSIVDPDAGQAAFQPQTNVPGTYGSFGVDAAGHWTYTLDNSRPVVQALAEGEAKVETFTVTSIDGTETTVTVNVIGTNDGPVATPDTATTNEDEPVTFAVLGNDTDPDGNTLTVTGASVDPAQGSVIVNANGTLTFTPAPNVNGPVTVTYTISDGNGGTATTTAIITVTPLPDTAILGTGTGTVKEDTPAQTSASGTLSIVDPDAGQAAFQPQTNVAGTYGNFGVDAAGNWTYTLDNSRPVVQALAEGEAKVETFTVTSIDGTETTVTVNVIGTNDGPVATPDTATTNEDEPVTFAVLGNDTDPDGNTLTVTGASVDPAQGSVIVNANGTLTFTPAPNVNGPVTVTYTISDGNGGTATTTAIINVTPLADTAVLGTGTGTVKEDTPTQTSASGTLSIVDPDAGQAAFQPQTNVPGTYGSFGVDAAGNWTYTLDNSRPVVQALAEGEAKVETFTVTSIDGTETTVTVNVIGTNDGPVATPDTATTNEDEPVTFAVLGNDTDPDGNTLTVTGASVDPAQGSVIVNANGTLTFTPAPNVNGPVTVTYTISDGNGGTATTTAIITVAPTNDAPTSGPSAATTVEDTAYVLHAADFPFADGDAGDSFGAVRITSLPTNGSLTLDGVTITGPVTVSTADLAAGKLKFVPDANENGLNYATFDYQVVDQNGGSAPAQTFTINVTPLADTAVLGTGAGTVKEDTPAQTSASGTLSIVDPDAGQAAFQPQTNVPGTYGSFGVDAAGNWTYTLDNSRPVVQALAEGEAKVETFTVTSIDGTETTVTVNVIGTNDGPVATPDTATTNEDEPVTFAVLGNDTDPDGNTLTVTGASVDPAQGSVIVNANGTLTFTPAPNVNGPVTVTYTISDGHGGTSSTTAIINVTPLADTAVLGTGTGTVKEDTPTQTSASGTLSIVDPDAGQAAFQPQTNVAGTYGSFGVDAAGNWTYTLDNSRPVVQALAEGEAKVETFTVTSIDGTETTVTVNVIGTNDGPVATPDTASTDEETPVKFAVLGNDSDPDSGDVLTVTSAVLVDPSKGSVIINADGTLTFTPAANITGPVDITYTISDGHGGTATSTARVNVLAVNDTPLALNDAADTTEDTAVSRSALTGVLSNDSDLDSPILTLSGARSGTSGAFTSPGTTGVTLTGIYGSLLIHADGSYTYTPGNAAQALNTGDTVQDVFSYQVSDGSLSANATLSITVNGASDAAIISGTASGLVKEDVTAQLTATGQLTATDVDSPATFVPATTSGAYGNFSMAGNGTWTYSLNNTANQVQALKEGDTRIETFTVHSVDGTPHNVSVTVLGTNEIPTVTNVGATGSEDPAAPIPVTLSGADVDGTVTSLTLADLPAHGTLYQDAAMTQPVSAGTALDTTTGTVTLYFKPDANWNGDTRFHFTATDNNGGVSAQATASLSVTAVNDPPVALADTGSTDQNTALTHNAPTGVISNDSDVDGNTLQVTHIAAGSTTADVTSGGTAIGGNFGNLLINPDGSYTYTPDAAAKALTQGQSATDVFTYTIADGNGGTATTTLSIDVTGKNDAPITGGVATGNVTEDGVTTASGALTISDADAGQSSFVPQTITGTYGTLTLQAGGSWSYSLNNADASVQGLKQDQQVVDHINVTTADGTLKEVAITITGTNDVPVVGNATVNVSEEGLTGGIADTSGTLDTTNLTTTSGTIGVSDTDGNTLVATLTAPTTTMSSGGVEITWTGSGTHTLVGSAGTTEIVRATIADNGNYTVKLSGPLDHPVTTSEDTLSLALGIKVSDGITTTTSTLTVIVEDDAPIASNVSQNIAVATVDTNLLIILDNSGSMNTSDGVDGTTRLKSAVEALKQLINRYDDFGEVRVRIVTFNSKASALGTTWTDVDIAKDQLTLVTPTGTTNYDSAITAGQSAFASTGKLASGQNLVYFLSDGQPNPGTEIGTADETAWKSFLQSNNVTSYALGMGTGAAQSPLDPIAYDGVTQTNLNGQVITDFNNLSSALQTTIPQPASGELLSGGLFGSTTGFGADGGNIRAITVDGVTYNYDATANGSVTVTGGASHGTYSTTTHQLTITTAAGGTLVVNMNTGSYTYTPIATVSTALKDGFSFVLVDKDGDLAGADVAFDISRAASSVINLSSTTTVIDSSKLGLTGEYYGYNETTSATNTSTHADDTTLGNLDHVSDMVSIIDGRSGETLVGTYDAAPASSADATFSADKIDYGFGYTTGTTTVGAVNGNLGANPTLGTDLAVNSGALYNFLRGGTVGSDASTLSTTSGLGNTTDSGIRLVGLINLNGGTYDIRVTADDGFRLNIGDQTVAMFDNIQSPTERIYTGVSLAAGLQPIEVLYWEQGGNARLRIEVKLSSEPDTSYKTLGTDDFALFSPTSAPVLGDLQDITEDSTQNGQWLVRTGQEQTGTSGNDQITGSDGQDIITGGAGNDTLTGGLGSDTFKWTLGDAGTTTKPALDAITDFNKASESLGGDVLDLRDLLQGESHTGTAVGNLGSYLHFEKSGSDTVVHVSTNGGYTGGTFTAVATDQKVVLQGVDLTNGGALATDSQIIQDLLTKGKLSAD